MAGEDDSMAERCTCPLILCSLTQPRGPPYTYPSANVHAHIPIPILCKLCQRVHQRRLGRQRPRTRSDPRLLPRRPKLLQMSSLLQYPRVQTTSHYPVWITTAVISVPRTEHPAYFTFGPKKAANEYRFPQKTQKLCQQTRVYSKTKEYRSTAIPTPAKRGTFSYTP